MEVNRIHKESKGIHRFDRPNLCFSKVWMLGRCQEFCFIRCGASKARIPFEFLVHAFGFHSIPCVFAKTIGFPPPHLVEAGVAELEVLAKTLGTQRNLMEFKGIRWNMSQVPNGTFALNSIEFH